MPKSVAGGCTSWPIGHNVASRPPPPPHFGRPGPGSSGGYMEGVTLATCREPTSKGYIREPPLHLETHTQRSSLFIPLCSLGELGVGSSRALPRRSGVIGRSGKNSCIFSFISEYYYEYKFIFFTYEQALLFMFSFSKLCLKLESSYL